MRVLERGMIIDAERSSGPRRCHLFPSLRAGPAGAILVTSRRGSDKMSADGNCLVARSADGGSTWRTICEGFATCFEDRSGEVRSAELATLDDGTVLAVLTWIERARPGEPLYDRDADTIRPSRLLLTRSADGGATWQPCQLLATGGACCPVLAGPVLRLPNRGWLVTFECQEPAYPGGPSVHAARALFSHDGRSFDTVLTVARDAEDRRFFYDQRQALSAAGAPVAAFWTYDRLAERDLDIHIAWGDAETLAWETPRGTGLDGQIAMPIALADGRLLLFYVRRNPPLGLHLIQSADGGRTWDRAGELVIHAVQGAEAPGAGGYAGLWEQMGRWTFGHPTALALDRRTLLLAYYAGPDPTCLSVHWCRVGV